MPTRIVYYPLSNEVKPFYDTPLIDDDRIFGVSFCIWMIPGTVKP